MVLAGALLSSRPVSLAAVSPEAVCWNSINRCIHTHGSFIRIGWLLVALLFLVQVPCALRTNHVISKFLEGHTK